MDPTQTQIVPQSLTQQEQLPVEVNENPPSKLQEFQDRERKRIAREEVLRNELDETKRKLAEFEHTKTVLAKNGWDLTTLTQVPMSGMPQRDPLVAELENKLAQMKNELSQVEQKMMDKEQLQDISDFVGKSDEYELIKAYRLERGVQDLIKDHYKNYQRVLSYDEAANFLEKHLEQLENQRAAALKNTKKASNWYKFDIEDIKVTKNAGITEKEIKKAVVKKEEEESTKEKASPPSREEIVRYKKPGTIVRKNNSNSLINEIVAKYTKKT